MIFDLEKRVLITKDSLEPSALNDVSSNNSPAVKIKEASPPLSLAEGSNFITAEDENKLQYSNGEKWEPQQLSPRHREMMRRIIEGATYIEIAESMGVSSQSIMLVANSEIFKTELNKLEAEKDFQVIRRAEELSNEALDLLKLKMRKAKSEALQASCADKILGIAGYSKIEKKQLQVISGEDVIRELNRRNRERESERINSTQFGTNGTSRETSRKISSGREIEIPAVAVNE
jgi:hypothetical protein